MRLPIGIGCLVAFAAVARLAGQPSVPSRDSMATSLLSVDGLVLGVRTTNAAGRTPGQAAVLVRRGRADSAWQPAQKAPEPLRAEGAGTLGFFRQTVAARKIPPAPDVPTTVILAGRPSVFPPSGLPFDTKLYADAVPQQRRQQLRGWVRGRGEFLVTANAGHLVHADHPETVIEAIRHVLQVR